MLFCCEGASIFFLFFVGDLFILFLSCGACLLDIYFLLITCTLGNQLFLNKWTLIQPKSLSVSDCVVFEFLTKGIY